MIDAKYAYALYNLRNRLGHSLRHPRFFKHYLSKVQQYSSPSQMDGFLISYPKSGRTWLQRIIVEAAIVAKQINAPIKDIFDLNIHYSDFPKIVATHAGACWEEKLRVLNDQEMAQSDDSAYLAKKVLVMIRDPRDVLVSQYYHMKYRTNIKSIQKEQLIESPIIGLKKQIAFLNKWHQHSKDFPGQVLSVSYEDLHLKPQSALKKIIAFWNLPLDEIHLQQGIKNAAFQKMRAKENAQTLTPWNYTPNTSNQQSFHARSGKTGEYQSFFDSTQQNRIQEILKEYLDKHYQDLWL